MTTPTRRAADAAAASRPADTMAEVVRLFPEPSLDPRVQTYVGDQLRAMYADLLRQPLPKHLKDLIEQMDERGPEGRQ